MKPSFRPENPAFISAVESVLFAGTISQPFRSAQQDQRFIS